MRDADDLPDVCFERDFIHVNEELGAKVVEWLNANMGEFGPFSLDLSEWWPYENSIGLWDVPRADLQKLWDWLKQEGYEVGDA